MGPAITNIIAVIILAAIIFLAVKSCMRHFSGEGGCCGGGDTPAKIKSRRLANIAATRTMTIDGMVCDNCSTRVHNALNSIDGISAKVNRSRGCAIIDMDRQIDDEVLTRAVTDLGYTVKEIR